MHILSSNELIIVNLRYDCSFRLNLFQFLLTQNIIYSNNGFNMIFFATI